ALLRWNTENGRISPGEFLPIAEESRLIIPLGYWVIEEACNKIVQWNDNLNLHHIAINVSTLQFNQPMFIEAVDKILEQTGANPNKLMFELTESVLVDNPQDIIAKMHQLKKWGISIAIDDFGTGYSSLAYLKDFPIDQLKIDQSFIQSISTDTSNQVIVKAIIFIASQMKFELIAEGVETIEQLNYLLSNDCTKFQGYYFNTPLPEYKFSEQYLK
ncbi:MAG: EAL domain-containing protein, partial [Methyloprofundus sp.]|nr:EAL domain-containing protein [Methyloprofundus sp.]